MLLRLSFTSTGETTFLTSLTPAPAEMITVPGENTFLSPYFWVIESESLPVGMLMPSSHAKSLHASTALYRRASSPSFLQGHIQFADRDTPLMPSFRGAQTMFVKDSAIARTEPAAGSESAAIGA